MRIAYLTVDNIPDGTVSTIEGKIVTPSDKITGFRSDGSAVMAGRREGIATRLKRLNAEMPSVHCGAHRLSLASSEAASSVSYLQRFNANPTTLFTYRKRPN